MSYTIDNQTVNNMKLLPFFLFFLCLLSCKNDDDIITNTDISDTNTLELDGKWSMISVTGGFIGTDHFFDKEVVVWIFDQTNKTIQVKNNNENNSLEDGLSSGTYEYSINTIEDNQELLINGNSIGNFELSDDKKKFILEEVFRDGFRYEFER